VMKYRLVVGGVGMVYEGKSEREAKRQFNPFVIQSKRPKIQIGSKVGYVVQELRNHNRI